MIEPNQLPMIRAAVLELTRALAHLPLLEYLAVHQLIEEKGVFVDARIQENFEVMKGVTEALYEAQQKIRELVTNADSSQNGGIITL